MQIQMSWTLFLSKIYLDLYPVETSDVLYRRTSTHLSDRAKVSVDKWLRHIDDDQAQLEQGL